MALASFRRRFAYHGWAITVLAEAVTDAGRHAEARHVLAHAVAADAVWLRRLRGASSDGMAIWPTLSADAIRDRARTVAAEVIAFLASSGDGPLDGSIVYHNSKGVRYETAIRDVLDHLLLHGSYHRGQVARALRLAGDEPPSTDYITWVRAHEG